MHTAQMLQCLLHFARWPIQHSQILNCALPNLQLHMVKSPFSHLHFYIVNLTSLHYFTGSLNVFGLPPPTQNPWVTQFVFKVFFAQLFFWAIFFWGQWVACSSGLPSYLLAYILTNLHAHLLRLPIHLPTYLPRCRPLSSPTYNLGYQLVPKFASMQIYKIKNYNIASTTRFHQ